MTHEHQIYHNLLSMTKITYAHIIYFGDPYLCTYNALFVQIREHRYLTGLQFS